MTDANAQTAEQQAAVEAVPKILRCFLSQEEVEKPNERQRWMGRFTFILAAIGSAIGLGNFWRFPYLTYKHGGAAFFFPWAMCLFVMGIPFMIMELALGQKFQRGDIAVFRGIHRRLAGIGSISVYSSYIFSFYYNVVVAWALIYVISAFVSPLPWSGQNPAVFNCPQLSRAQEFYQVDVIRIRKGDCEHFVMPDKYDSACPKGGKDADGNDCLALPSQYCLDRGITAAKDCYYKDEITDPTEFSQRAVWSTFATWIIIFFCVWKGVKSSSWIVWLTVPLPVCFVFVMIINGATLPGAGTGIEMYFGGKAAVCSKDDLECLKGTTAAEQWSDAAGQIFLGLSVCLGIMTSYGSYNEIRKPIILDSVIISVCNCGFSFIAGFAVWAVVGYLKGINLIDSSQMSGVSLAFIAYPTAIDLMSGAGFWAFILGFTLFLLGIDSSFSAIEATSTVICDTAWSGKAPRMFIALVLCIIGFLGSIPFCTNWGFILFDVVDHYLCAYLLLIIGILQALGCGWFFETDAMMPKSEGHKNAIVFLGVWYWMSLVIIGTVTVFTETAVIGMAVFFPVFLVAVAIGYFMSKLSPKDYYYEVLMCGVRKIGYACAQMGREDKRKMQWWEPAFVLYWGLTVKFINPMLLYFILMSIFKNDLAKPYGGYQVYWQAVGWAIPICGFVIFILSFFFMADETVLNYKEFELYDEMTPEALDALIEEERVEKEKAEAEAAAAKAGTVAAASSSTVELANKDANADTVNIVKTEDIQKS